MGKLWRLPWLGLSLLLIGLAGCASAAITSLSVAQHQSTTLSTVGISHAPTPPSVNPLVVVTVAPHPTQIPTIAPTTSAPTPTTLASVLLPTPTPDNAPMPLGKAGLPNENSEPQQVATVTYQLQQPIDNTPPPLEELLSTPVANETAAVPTPPAGQPSLPVASDSQMPKDLVWDGVQRTAKVPILMYHYLSAPPADADIYRKDLSVAPELFNAQLDRIQAEGYTTISLYDLVNYLTTGQSLPAKSLIITFDDGYRDNYENAFPALKAHGMKATFFVVMEFINAQRPEYMTWDMLREMHNANMSVEAHGVDHSSLKKRERDFLDFQALRCYETLQNELGQRARFISYPAGQYDQATIDIFRSAGYWAGITTIQGATHATNDLFELRRVRVRGTTSPDDLAKLLATDW
ncbi:MAG: polysaccharide deacetylase family protein [Caldilineaceae bacterium]